MLPFTQYRNLEYVRHFLHTLTNYTFATSSIVCNYYALNVNETKTFEGQVQTAPSEQWHNLVFDLYMLQPIYNVQPLPFHLTTENNSVLQQNSGPTEAYLIFDKVVTQKFEPKLGDRVAFSPVLTTLLQRQSSVLYKVVGIEILQRDFSPIYKLTLDKDKTLQSEKDLPVKNVFGFVPVINKYRHYETFVRDLKVIEALKNFSFGNFCKDLNATIGNSAQIYYCAKVLLGLIERPELASLIKATTYDRQQFFSKTCSDKTELRVYETNLLEKMLYITKLSSDPYVVIAYNGTDSGTSSQSTETKPPWYKLRLIPTIGSSNFFQKLNAASHKVFDLKGKLDTLKAKTIDELLENVATNQLTIEGGLSALVLAYKLLYNDE